ncbi:aminodeoxychorismate synthase component 1 [Mangrovibacter sp. MFB070]|uniref:aminodeoxychorismate synthase component 1 n=1 Tax=Mangrovibacter sp. MFB070 TaxID=1224318 RepID=UPI0005669B6A|nr:aminodeoxychorismate synthase component 1 [Mangrovibacter sp. MFB070]
MPAKLHQLPLPWHADAITHYFAKLSNKTWAMLLHSGNAEHPYSRFDILVADPCATLVSRNGLSECYDGQNTSSLHGDPLAHLNTLLERFPFTPDVDESLPFQGGALGLFGYDLGRQYERLPSHALADLHTPDIAVGIYDWALIADHQHQALTLISWQNADTRLAWLESQEPGSPEPFQLTSAWQSNMTQAEYRQKFSQIQHWLHSGDCYQVNLAQRFSARYQGDEWQAYLELTEANRAPFSAFLRLPGSTILSVSPERFIYLHDNHIQTRPIKGTLPRLPDPAADKRQAERLAASTKDQAENLMIVDLMRNDIGRVAVPGSVRVPELFVVEPFPAVHHLVSTITARLPDDKRACDLLRACFPGGSITGAPKIRAMEIIESLEPQRRNAWCGSIGYLSFCGSMDTSITIRTLTAEQGYLYCSAGGGIVADSEADAEYQETFDKVSRILGVLTE